MKASLEQALKINPKLNPKLFLPTPEAVLRAIEVSPIKDWLNFIANEYVLPRKVSLLLLVPCSAYKPYSEARDELYRRLIYEIKPKLKNARMITVSIPLALEPEEYWNLQWRGYNLIYDCPFFPGSEKLGFKWEGPAAEEVTKKLRKVIESFWKRNKDYFEYSLAFLVPSSPDRPLVEGFVDEIVPDFDPPTVENPSYDNNASEVYCYPSVWKVFLEAIKSWLHT